MKHTIGNNMKNVKSVIELLIKHISAEDIIREKIKYNKLSKNQFLDLALPYMKEYTESELENIYESLSDMILTEHEKQFIDGSEESLKKGQLNFFGLLLLVVKRILQFRSGEVVCQYTYLMDWRELTVKISEDTFTLAFCAAEDLKARKNRFRFDWPTVIGHNNLYLNKLMQQDMSDNHFHLWASSPYFNLSWVRIMNDTDDLVIRQKLEMMNLKKQNINQAYYQGYRENKFEIQYLQAALIRLYLFSWITQRQIQLREYYIFNHGNESILYQIETGIMPVYKERFQSLNCKNADTEWQIQFKEECSDAEELRNIIIFLKRLQDHDLKIPQTPQKSFWECMVEFFATEEKIPLKILETIMQERVYKDLWQICTVQTVEAWIKDEKAIQLNNCNIQLAINEMGRGHRLERIPDYVLWELPEREQLDYQVRWKLCGERYFLYRMFQKAYQRNTEDAVQLNLFYAYLVIKESLRSEIIQTNDRIGFRNFQRYDRRKGILLDTSSFEADVLEMAIEDTLSNQWLRHLEVRIKPKDTIIGNVKYIRQIEKGGNALRSVEDDYVEMDVQKKKRDLRNRYYFVYHFVKSADDTPNENLRYSCRHERKRAEIKQQARSIAGLREQYPKEGKRVLGIDACSMEIDCRPEVFAQAFRYLKNHCVVDRWKSDEERDLPQLKATYHVGEDYLDIIDGMRAIDEAVHFLNLNCGERLGHALALGIDVKEYYKVKKRVICLPKQDYLDNLAWIYNRITKYRLGEILSNLQNYVEREFNKYFLNVYDSLSQQHNYNIRTYFEAWQLRGDNPEFYRFGKFSKPAWHTETEGEYRTYDSYAVNYQYPRNYNIRRIEAVAYLYYMYHYDKDVKIRGKEKTEVVVPECWVEGAEILQKMLQREIAVKGISIESNPTSNCMISILDGYENHPIVKWYNYHLVQDSEKIRECPQLSVSINTDDKGCFSTSLENEYALMACALEQAKDENGLQLYNRTMIYEWLDSIRKMGNLQSFQEDERDAQEDV